MKDIFTKEWIISNAIEEIFDYDLNSELHKIEAKERILYRSELKQFVNELKD